MHAAANAVAGALGGVTAMSLLYPLENIRLRLQVQIKLRKKLQELVEEREETRDGALVQQQQRRRQAASAAAAEKDVDPRLETDLEQRPYEGEFDCVRRVIAEEGWPALYKGLKSTLVGIGVSCAVYFFWYDVFKRAWVRRRAKKTLTAVENLVVAMEAGVLNCLMTIPFWVVSTRMALQKKRRKKQSEDGEDDGEEEDEYAGMADCVRQIVHKEGVRGLYTGLIPALVLVSNPCIQFVTYEQLTNALVAVRTKRVLKGLEARGLAAPSERRLRAMTQLSPFQHFVLGAFAKALATIVTYPTQVIKSRMQKDNSPYTGMWDCARTTWKNEGLPAFYAGLRAKMTQTVLNSAFMFATYEQFMRVTLWIIGKLKG